MMTTVVDDEFVGFVFQIIQELVRDSQICVDVGQQLQVSLMKLVTNATGKKSERSPFKQMMARKATIVQQTLQRRQYQLIFVVNKQVGGDDTCPMGLQRLMRGLGAVSDQSAA